MPCRFLSAQQQGLIDGSAAAAAAAANAVVTAVNVLSVESLSH